MGSFSGTSEIIESKEEKNMVNHSKGSNLPSIRTKHGYSVEDEVNQLIEAIDLRTSSRGLSPLQKNNLKRPIRVGISQASGIGISESVTLKQALRGLCISQASEMAAMKRLSKPAGLSGVSEAGTIKRLYRSVVVQTGESGLPFDEDKKGLVEISFVPEKGTSQSSQKRTASLKVPKAGSSNQSAASSPRCVVSPTSNVKSAASSPRCVVSPTSNVMKTKMSLHDAINDKLNSGLPVSKSTTGSQLSQLSQSSASPRSIKPACRNKIFVKKKGKQDSTSEPSNSSTCNKAHSLHKDPSTRKLGSSNKCTQKNVRKELASPASTISNQNVEMNSSTPNLSSNSCNRDRNVGMKTSDSSRSREKGECSQSSKSSIGEYSSSTSNSEESNLSGSSGNGNRPHMSKDSRWEAIRLVEVQHGSLGLRHFKLLKKLGCGDIGTVYLAELTGTKCLFALKVMDNDFLASRKKMLRAQTEREILQMLDHPFLPTLYTHFTTDKFSCLVMEYCPGGDLHVLRQRQPGRSFSEQAARFYAAEVLLALEYLHMLGVVYRDLKPENILVRLDGHIMLTDFDLSLRCAVSPTLLKSSSSSIDTEKKLSGPCADSTCIDPLCLHPSWVQMPSCFTPRLISAKTRKLKCDPSDQVNPLPQLVAEPTNARSNSFVGTHEYLAPEIIKGEGHGSAVDWWTFGIFLYELLFGKTPFKGLGNEDTLANVVTQSLTFPENPAVSFLARDLIGGLLIKEPENRLASARGASEIKRHPFFEGMNWALIRCAIPPETPESSDVGILEGAVQEKESKKELKVSKEDIEFELF